MDKYAKEAAVPFEYDPAAQDAELMAAMSRQVVRLQALQKMEQAISALIKGLVERESETKERVAIQVGSVALTMEAKIIDLRDGLAKQQARQPSPAAKASDQQIVGEMRKRADKLKEEDRLASFKLAVRSYTQMIVLNSKDGKSYFCRGQCHRELGDYERAVSDFSEAAKLEPDNSEYHAHRAWAFWLMGKFQAGLEDCERTLELRASHPWATSLRGLLKIRTGSQLEGMEDLSREEDNELALYFKGCAFRRMDEWERAVAIFTRGLKLKEHWRLYNERGYCYSLMAKYELAIADYTKSIEFDPTNSLHFRNRADALLEIGREEEAQADKHQADSLET